MDVLKVRLWMGVQSLSWETVGQIMRIINRLEELAGLPNFAYLQYVQADFVSFTWFRVSWWTLTQAIGQPHTRPTILDLMERTRHFKATDPRDRFFALLHIATDTAAIFRTENLISPDYTKSVDAVVRDFTNWQLQQEGSLKILLSENDMMRFTNQARLHRVHAPNQDYNHHWTTTCKTLELPSSLLMRFGLKNKMEGRRMTCIKAPLSTELCFSQQTRSLNFDVESLHTIDLPVRNVCAIALSATLMGSVEYGFAQMVGISSRSPGWDIYPAAQSHSQELSLERTFSKYTQQRIFSTHDGNIMLGHVNVLPGDCVVILQDVEVPFILRRLHAGRYQAIGPGRAVDPYKKEHHILDEVFGMEDE
jgi:hypothetical protein